MAASKRARKIRKAEEFDGVRLASALRPPIPVSDAHAWSLAEIRDARDQQMNGQFFKPVQLAAAFRTCPALAAPFKNRLAPERVLGIELVPAKGARGEAVGREGDALFGKDGVCFAPGARADILGCLVNHGIAIGVNTAVPREDGSRVDFFHAYWPLEWVRWYPTWLNPDGSRGALVTQVDPHTPESELQRDAPSIFSTALVPITHGDGRWVIYQHHQEKPWTQDAAVLWAALLWAANAHANRDWSRGSTSHGNAKVVGEMPEGMALADEDGALTVQAKAFLDLLQAIASLDMPVGIRPAGSKTELLTNNSPAWQVWKELADKTDKYAARGYLGTDGTMGSQGGAPGVDIAALFGVATTIVQGDLACLERGIREGVIEPWAAMNFGDSSLAPGRHYMIPDADAEGVVAAYASRSKAFHEDVAQRKALGYVVDAATLATLAEKYDVLAPVLPESSEAPTVTLAPRMRADGTPDPSSNMTGSELEAKKAQAQPPAPAAPVPLRAVP